MSISDAFSFSFFKNYSFHHNAVFLHHLSVWFACSLTAYVNLLTKIIEAYLTCSYGRAKQRYARGRDDKLSAGLHLASAAEAGGLVCTIIFMPVTWLVFFWLRHLHNRYQITYKVT